MSRICSYRRWLPALAVLGLTAPGGRADIVKLDKLTQPLLRTRVQGYLGTEDAGKLISPIATLARVSADQITYEARDGKPVRLVSAYVPVRTLQRPEEEQVDTTLRKVLREVFGNYEGGLLSDNDAATVLAVVAIRSGRDEAGPRPGGVGGPV